MRDASDLASALVAFAVVGPAFCCRTSRDAVPSCGHRSVLCSSPHSPHVGVERSCRSSSQVCLAVRAVMTGLTAPVADWLGRPGLDAASGSGTYSRRTSASDASFGSRIRYRTCSDEFFLFFEFMCSVEFLLFFEFRSSVEFLLFFECFLIAVVVVISRRISWVRRWFSSASLVTITACVVLGGGSPPEPPLSAGPVGPAGVAVVMQLPAGGSEGCRDSDGSRGCRNSEVDDETETSPDSVEMEPDFVAVRLHQVEELTNFEN